MNPYEKTYHVRYVYLQDSTFYDRLLNPIQVKRLFEVDKSKVQVLYIKSLKKEKKA